MSVVEYEIHGGVGRITLNRPRVLNASNLEMKRALQQVFAAAAADDDVGVLILTGAGRAFCTGGDMKEAASYSAEDYRQAIREQHRVCAAIHDIDKPVIAAINGYALGGGLEMAMLCDIRIAAASAQIGVHVTKVGSVATGGLYQRLIRAIGLARATDMALTAATIGADEAERIGLVSRTTQDARLLDLAEEIAARIAAFPRIGVTLAKRALRRAADVDFAAALERDVAFAIAARGEEPP